MVKSSSSPFGSAGAAASEIADPVSSWALFLKVWRVAIMYFKADSKRKARLLLSVVLILCLLCQGMLVLLSYVQRDFSTALSEKDVDGFYWTTWKFVVMVVVATPLFSFYDYMQNLLAVEWRVWLTGLLLSDYFANRAYFDLKMEGKLDNPDQRICEDVAGFVKNAVDIITLISDKVVKICVFAGVLWSISPELLYFLLIYSALGTFLAVRVFGDKIMHLKYQGLQKEADFRYSLVRIRDNVESIAFYRGERHELALIKGFFSSLISNTRELITWSRHLSLFRNAYEYAIIIVPSLIIAPRYFAGKVEFGVISQAGFVFQSILSALSIIVLKFDSFSGLAAQTERLDGLLAALRSHGSNQILIAGSGTKSLSNSTIELEAPGDSSLTPLLNLVPAGYICREAASSLVVKGLCVATPNLRSLVIKDLDLALSPGDSLLVMGPSGCGKSSFMRAIAGLWNRGEGLIQGPSQKDTFFLPQKPYMPLGTLREQLLFPSSKSKSEYLNDDNLVRSLKEVSLEDLQGRVGGLDAVCDWADVLSVGEQQRLAFARLLLHQPKIAFLDEASSALDSVNESRLYTLLNERIPSYVSIGHRTSLVKFHAWVLEFGENYEWKLYQRRDFKRLHSII